MQTLTRAALLDATKTRYMDFPLRFLPGTKARIRSLTETERSALDAQNFNSKGEWDPAKAKGARRRMLVATLVDDNGKQLLTAEDVETLAAIDGGVTADLYAAALSHCGYDKADVERLEDAEKN